MDNLNLPICFLIHNYFNRYQDCFRHEGLFMVFGIMTQSVGKDPKIYKILEAKCLCELIHTLEVT